MIHLKKALIIAVLAAAASQSAAHEKHLRGGETLKAKELAKELAKDESQTRNLKKEKEQQKQGGQDKDKDKDKGEVALGVGNVGNYIPNGPFPIVYPRPGTEKFTGYKNIEDLRGPNNQENTDQDNQDSTDVGGGDEEIQVNDPVEIGDSPPATPNNPDVSNPNQPAMPNNPGMSSPNRNEQCVGVACAGECDCCSSHFEFCIERESLDPTVNQDDMCDC